MNTEEKMKLAEWVLSYAKKGGADQCEVNIFTSQAVDIEVYNGKIDKIKEAIKNSLSITLYVNQRYSVQGTNDLNRERLQELIDETLVYTRYLAPDPYRSLIEPALFAHQKNQDLKINDPAYPSLNMKQKIDLTRSLEDTALAQSDQIISVTASWGDFKSESIKLGSNGFSGLKQSTLFSLSTEVTIDDQGKGRPEDYAFASTRFFSDLPSPAKISSEAVQRAMGKIGQKKIGSGVYDMIVENRSAGRLLQYLIAPLSGKALQQKNSFLEKQLNRKIASEKLTIIDQPFKSKGLGSRHYDSEGITARKQDIILKGVLKSFYIDHYYGKKLEVPPTSGSSSNLLVTRGEKSLPELINTVREGFLITDFIGGNANSATGDFSLGVIGRYIRNGVIQHPMNEMNISGNFLTLLGNLKETGNDVFKYSIWYSPSLYFTDVNFSGI
jgi:PmbA protein